MPDYQKGKIYQLTNAVNDEIYVGSTIEDLHTRLYKHKHDAGRMQTPIYKLMGEIGKDNFYIELIENYPCNSRTELLAREGHFIRERGTINKQIAGRGKKEYYNDNKERIADWGKKYREVNHETRNAQKREHYQQHKELLKEISKEYRDTHKEQQKEYMKRWMADNKESISEKKRIYAEANKDKLQAYQQQNVECTICGVCVRMGSLIRHKKTNKCINYKIK